MARSRKKKPAALPFAERYAPADLRRLEPTPAEAELERILRELGAGALAGEFRRVWPVIASAWWRAALDNLRRNPTTLREPACALYYWPGSALASTFSMLHASPREFGEPLAVSYGPA